MVSESTAPGLNLQSGCNRVAFRFQVSGHRPLIQRATMPAKCLRAPMLGSFANSRPIGASFAQRSNAGVPKAGLKVVKVMGPKCGLKVERMVSYRCRENTNDADIVKDRNMGIVHPEPAPVLQSTGTCNHFPDTASICSGVEIGFPRLARSIIRNYRLYILIISVAILAQAIRLVQGHLST